MPSVGLHYKVDLRTINVTIYINDILPKLCRSRFTNTLIDYLRHFLEAVHAKPCLSQVNDRQNLSATGRIFGFTCHNDR